MSAPAPWPPVCDRIDALTFKVQTTAGILGSLARHVEGRDPPDAFVLGRLLRALDDDMSRAGEELEALRRELRRPG